MGKLESPKENNVDIEQEEEDVFLDENSNGEYVILPMDNNKITRHICFKLVKPDILTKICNILEAHKLDFEVKKIASMTEYLMIIFSKPIRCKRLFLIFTKNGVQNSLF